MVMIVVMVKIFYCNLIEVLKKLLLLFFTCYAPSHFPYCLMKRIISSKCVFPTFSYEFSAFAMNFFSEVFQFVTTISGIIQLHFV